MPEYKNRESLLLKDLTPEKLHKIIKYTIVSVLFLWAGSAVIIYLLSCNWSERGTFGDMFGAINALFSGLAFGGVVLAILLQSKELEYQRDELRETREEIRGQKEQLEMQNATMNTQLFENTFFQMMRYKIDLVNSMEHIEKKGLKATKGQKVLNHFYYELRMFFHGLKNDSQWASRANSFFYQVANTYMFDINTYFNNISNILSFIDRKGPESNDEKILYAQILASQMTKDEMYLLFYYCVTDYANPHLKELIEKYSFFKDIQPTEMFAETHINAFSKKAFS